MWLCTYKIPAEYVNADWTNKRIHEVIKIITGAMNKSFKKETFSVTSLAGLIQIGSKKREKK